MTSHHDQCRLSSAIVSMTRSWHCAMTNIVLVAPSPARLSSDITQWPMLPQQRHREQDSTTTSRHDQCLLDSAITNMIWLSDIMLCPTSPRHRHHQHDSTMTSRHGQHRLGGTIASMTRQQRHATTNVTLKVSSSAWLGSTPWPTSTRQHYA
jgi:hypothetical protein